jgi:hypothetical protein
MFNYKPHKNGRKEQKTECNPVCKRDQTPDPPEIYSRRKNQDCIGSHARRRDHCSSVP